MRSFSFLRLLVRRSAASVGIFAFLIVLLLSTLAQLGVAQATLDAVVVEALSNAESTCYTITPNPTAGVVTELTTLYLTLGLPYTGTVDEAHLLLGSNNVRNDPGNPHPILVNGVVVGNVLPDGRTGCTPGPVDEYPIPPTLLRPGPNQIVLTAAGTSDQWYSRYVALRVRGQNLRAGTFRATQFISSDDGRMVGAQLLEPFAYRSDQTTSRPLLLLFHGWSGRAIDPLITDYVPAAVARDWFIASPQQRGEDMLGIANAPLAALRSQHDAISLIQHMQSQYPIDPDRIYVGGFSMGGMMATTLAAKYPDLFAAAVNHKGIGDLSDWFYEEEWRQPRMITETGGTPATAAWEYMRRSPVQLAHNLKNLPYAIAHGSSDTVVLPHHAQEIYDALTAVDPLLAELHWYAGNHADEPTPFGGEWAARFMESHTRLANPASLRLRTDEAKPFYWLTIGKRSAKVFTTVGADVDRADEHIRVNTDDTQPVDLKFDLARMNLDSRASYIISQTNSVQGTTIAAATPLNGNLSLTAPSGQTRLDIFPNRGTMPVQLILQDGVNGYTGATDTWLNGWSTSTNYGAAPSLTFRSNNVGKALIRFDLQNALPPGVEILSARLSLYADAIGPDMTISPYRLLKPWSETSATYQQAAPGQPWSAPGGAAGSDWEAAAAGTSLSLLASDGAGYRSLDLLSTVKTWAADPVNNYGIVLVPATSSYSGANSVDSSDHQPAATRPRLEIIYQPQPPAPTPTPTATPTSTPTATPPASPTPTATPTSTSTPTATPTASPTPTPTPTSTPLPGIVQGVVYEDLNHDASFQPGEPLLAGATVRLRKGATTLGEQITAMDGAFAFVNLPPDAYDLRETAPPGYASARPTDHLLVSVAAATTENVDFGHQPLPTPTPTITATPPPIRLFIPLVTR